MAQEWTFVQDKESATTDTASERSTVSCTLDSSPTAGNLLVVVANGQVNPGTAHLTLSNTGWNSGWTLIGSRGATNGIGAWYKIAESGDGTQITVTGISSLRMNCWIGEYEGQATSGDILANFGWIHGSGWLQRCPGITYDYKDSLLITGWTNYSNATQQSTLVVDTFSSYESLMTEVASPDDTRVGTNDQGTSLRVAHYLPDGSGYQDSPWAYWSGSWSTGYAQNHIALAFNPATQEAVDNLYVEDDIADGVGPAYLAQIRTANSASTPWNVATDIRLTDSYYVALLFCNQGGTSATFSGPAGWAEEYDAATTGYFAIWSKFLTADEAAGNLAWTCNYGSHSGSTVRHRAIVMGFGDADEDNSAVATYRTEVAYSGINRNTDNSDAAYFQRLAYPRFEKNLAKGWVGLFEASDTGACCLHGHYTLGGSSTNLTTNYDDITVLKPSIHGLLSEVRAQFMLIPVMGDGDIWLEGHWALKAAGVVGALRASFWIGVRTHADPEASDNDSWAWRS
jgi:hypothetical protein